MGNAQSHGQPHNRLAKPKTNRNSPPLSPDNDIYADSPVSFSGNANLSARDRQQIKSELLSPVQTNFERRDSVDVGTPAEDSVQRRLSSRTSSLLGFRSRRGSSSRLSSLSASKVSLVQSKQTVDIETAISILQEVQKNATPEDIAALRQALSPCASSPSPRPASLIETGLSRRTSILNRSTSSLTRRRSLLATPGLATRNSPVVEGNRRWSSWKTPRLDAQEEAKWRRSDASENSPQARIAPPDLEEEEQEPSTPRAQTPADNEYSHIGTLQLGSLRIANGEPSPAASAKFDRYEPEPIPPLEDYFSDTQNSPVVMKLTKKRRHGRSKSALPPPTPSLYRGLRLLDDARRAKTISRHIEPPKPEAPKQQEQQQQQRFQSWPLPYEELDAEPEPVRRLRVMNKSHDTLATMLDLQPEALTNDPEHFQTASIIDYDEGFASDDDATTRKEEPQIVESPVSCEPIGPASKPIQENQHDMSTPKGPRKPIERPPPTKADSGYSSGGSFKNKHREAWTTGTVPTVSKEPSMATDSRKSENGTEEDDAASVCTLEQMPQASNPQELPPPGSTNEHVTNTPKQQDLFKVDMKETSLPLDWNIDDISLAPRTPRSAKAQSNSTSLISPIPSASNASTPRRLQKRNSALQEPPVLQACDSIPEGTIPSIPAMIRKRITRRFSETPCMESRTQTYPNDHKNSEEPKAEAESSYVEPTKLPSRPVASEQEPRGRRRESDGAEPSSSIHRLRRSLSLFRRKTREDKEEEKATLPDELAALDLGSAALSLGHSPYDVALSTAHQKRRSSATYPHQLGNARPRAKTMVSMDAETAAKLARDRSKDRASMRPQMPQRPQSYYSQKQAMGHTDMYRRHSFYGHVPPMPTIPSVGDFHAVSCQSGQERRIPEASHGLHKSQSHQTPHIRQALQAAPTARAPQELESRQVVRPSPPNEANSGRKVRAKTFSTGRGRLVTPLIEKFDNVGQPAKPAVRPPRYYAALQESRPYIAASDPISRRNKNTINHPDWA